MKIAFVANTCWNIFNFRNGLVQYFLSRGDQVLVLAPRDEYSDRIKEWGVEWIDTPLDSTGGNPIQDLRYLMSLRSNFKRNKPDIALCFTIKSNIYSCLAGKVSGVPVICNVSGLGTVFLTKEAKGNIAMLLYRMAFRFASHVFFQNPDDKALFISRINLKDDRVGLLPGSGINLKDFPYSVPKESAIVKVLMISRLIIEKGVREYAEAASQFLEDNRVSFSLVGKFDESHARSIGKQELDAWIVDGRIHYHPHSDNIKKMIAEHELIVLPSYREGTPRTLLEAGAMGRALLASDVPGCREVVVDGSNGFLFQVKNVTSLVDKIELYLSLTSDEKRTLSENSRKLVEDKFDEQRVIDMYVDKVYRITGNR